MYGEILTFLTGFSIEENSSIRTGSESGKPVHEVTKKCGKEGQGALADFSLSA
jgi:hypothetical protein